MTVKVKYRRNLYISSYNAWL